MYLLVTDFTNIVAVMAVMRMAQFYETTCNMA